MVGNGGEWWGMVENGGEWWGMVGNGGEWWGMMGNGGEWWGMVGNGGEWWGMVGNGGEWWGMVENGGEWGMGKCWVGMVLSGNVGAWLGWGVVDGEVGRRQGARKSGGRINCQTCLRDKNPNNQKKPQKKTRKTLPNP